MSSCSAAPKVTMPNVRSFGPVVRSASTSVETSALASFGFVRLFPSFPPRSSRRLRDGTSRPGRHAPAGCGEHVQLALVLARVAELDERLRPAPVLPAEHLLAKPGGDRLVEDALELGVVVLVDDGIVARRPLEERRRRELLRVTNDTIPTIRCATTRGRLLGVLQEPVAPVCRLWRRSRWRSDLRDHGVRLRRSSASCATPAPSTAPPLTRTWRNAKPCAPAWSPPRGERWR